VVRVIAVAKNSQNQIFLIAENGSPIERSAFEVALCWSILKSGGTWIITYDRKRSDPLLTGNNLP
jgi:hypothetical protein